MKKSSIFWLVNWEQGSLSAGDIRLNDTPIPEAGCQIGGYIHLAARSAWWTYMNSIPTRTSQSDLLVFYRVPSSQQ